MTSKNVFDPSLVPLADDCLPFMVAEREVLCRQYQEEIMTLNSNLTNSKLEIGVLSQHNEQLCKQLYDLREESKLISEQHKNQINERDLLITKYQNNQFQALDAEVRKCALLLNERDALKSKVTNLESELQTLRSTEETQVSKKMQEYMVNSEKKMASLCSDLTTQIQNLQASLRHNSTSHQNLVEDLKKKISETERMNMDYIIEVEDLKKKLSEAEIERLELGLSRDSFSSKCSEYLDQINSLSSISLDKTESEESMRSELESLQTRYSVVLELLGEREEQIQDFKDMLHETKKLYQNQISMILK